MNQSSPAAKTKTSSLSTRFCGIAAILLVLGGVSLWNTREMVDSFVPFLTNTLTRPLVSSNNNTLNHSSIRDTDGAKPSVDNDARHDGQDTYQQYLDSQNYTNSSTTILPEALQPVRAALTVRECCGNGKNKYFQTCLTEQACFNNTVYPFTSQQERQRLQKWFPRKPIKSQLRQACRKANNQLQPPHKWCSSDGSTISHDTAFPMGCSLFGMAGGSGPYDRVLIFPSGKLAFCGIPKSGVTQWLQFLRFTLGAKDYQSMPYFKLDANPFYLDKRRPEIRDAIWKTYTKAILIREPAERLLSAYLDKVYRIQDSPNLPFGPNVTFADFVDILAMQTSQYSNEYRGLTGISWYTDPHWRPQAWSCGLSEDMASFDYIGNLDNAAHHTKTLLQQVDMWDTFGKHYRLSAKGKEKGPLSSRWPPPPLEPGETAAGFQQEGTNQNDRHNQNSKAKLEKYYTPELMKKVREIYWMDFQLWDALQEAEKEGLFRGRDIVKKLNPKCAYT